MVSKAANSLEAPVAAQPSGRLVCLVHLRGRNAAAMDDVGTSVDLKSAFGRQRAPRRSARAGARRLSTRRTASYAILGQITI